MDTQIPFKQEKECIRIATKGCLSRQHQISQPAFTCSKLTIETLEQGVKYVQS